MGPQTGASSVLTVVFHFKLGCCEANEAVKPPPAPVQGPEPWTCPLSSPLTASLKVTSLILKPKCNDASSVCKFESTLAVFLM